MKKSSKSLVMPIFIILLSSISLSGCDNSYGNSSGGGDVSEDILETIMSKYDHLNYEYTGEPCQINLAHWDGIGENVEKAVLESMLKGFHKRYPSITAKVKIYSSYETTYPNMLAANNADDVFMVPDGSFPAWAKMNRFVNLEQFINSSELIDIEDIYESALTRYRYNASTGMPNENGVQLSLPKDIGPQVMYYNKSAFDEMGVPYPDDEGIMTVEEARDMWLSLTKLDSNNNIQRYAVSGLSVEGLVWSAGGDFLNPQRTAFPTDTATLDGLRAGYQFLQDAYVFDEITPPSSWTAGYTGDRLFAQQKVACFVGLKANVSSFRSLSFDWDVCQVPAFTDIPTKNAWSGSVGYSVFNRSQNIEAAWKLVEYITSREGQEILSATGFQIPLYSDLAHQEDFLAREKELGPHNYEAFLEAAEGQPYGTWQYRSDLRWKTLGYDATSELLFSTDPSTRITVEEFLDKARTAVTNYL